MLQFSNGATRGWALLGCTALAATLVLAGPSQAQNAGAAPLPPSGSNPTSDQSLNREQGTPSSPEAGPTAPAQATGSTDDGVQDIIVTAQKREQRLQDVPIAITAITQDRLQANRVVNVTDLSGLAPNVTIRASAGGSAIPAVTSRGITSYGVVPGSDKEFSIYLDGVYISSSHSLFDLPDIQRIEVLRGPQGTLFGRNSTSGAVSVVTRDPAGEFGVHQDATIGNFNQVRSRTSIDLPAVGPFSAYVSYVHDQRRGDIKNLGAGTFWDRTGPQTHMGAQVSPRYLGSKNQDQVFVAVKFQPSSNFKSTYKFDWSVNHFTPEGTAIIGYNTGPVAGDAGSALLNPLVAALLTSQPTPVLIDANARRPEYVNNSFVVGGTQKNYGHNLTSELQLGDHVSLKNIAAYRYTFVTSASQISGAGGLVLTPQALAPLATLAAFSSVPGLASAPPATQAQVIGQFAAGIAPSIGQRFVITDTNAQSRGKQWSDELQLNYTSTLMNLTIGGLYFHQNDRTGGPPGIHNTFSFMIFSQSGRIPLGDEGTSYNKATSIAGYAQAEIHLTPTLDAVVGGRLTHDKKSGSFVSGGTYVFPAGAPDDYINGSFTGQTISSFNYKKSKFTYSAGLNYKPNQDILVYGKYSTGFVSGGSIGNIPWVPETVQSAEAGVKADLLDRKLRTNLAVFWAKYRHVQTAQAGTNIGRSDLGTVIIDAGTLRAQGIELETTLVPARGITLNGSFGYTDAKYLSITPLIVGIYGQGYKPTLLPKFTANLSGEYESQPLFNSDARFVARVDADWRSRETGVAGAIALASPAFQSIRFIPQRWLVNSRVGFRDLGPLHLDVSVWGRNLNNTRVAQFPLTFLTYIASSSFEQARTYGLDVSVRF